MMKANPYYTHDVHGPFEVLELGDITLESGITLPNARLAYRTFGKLSAAKDNAILFPHMYSGTHLHMERFIGRGMALDPEKFFIILPGQFGNGLSSSPSNTAPPFNQGLFPHVTIGDDVRAQYELVARHFGIAELQLVLGWSMGAEQTYEWAVRYPEMVKRAAPIAGTAKTTPHDYLFVQLHEETLRSDPAFRDGFYADSTDVELGLRRHALVWSVMGLCPEFYREEAWRRAGYTSLTDFRKRFWEAYFLPMDANNLLTMAWKWRHGDVSRHTNGDLAAALGRITAKTFVIPFEKDMFFPVADCAAEQELIPNSELRVVPSLWGHFAMFAIFEEDKRAIDALLKELLAAPVPTRVSPPAEAYAPAASAAPRR